MREPHEHPRRQLEIGSQCVLINNANDDDRRKQRTVHEGDEQ